jgi:hypothetical protein
MHEDDRKYRPIHENLDTAYVNLAALLRYLRGHDFNGRVHVSLDEYEADIFLEGGLSPRVRETDHAAGREAEGDAALQRLLVRSSEPGGQISVYAESADDEVTDDARAFSPARASEDHNIEAEEIAEPGEIAWPDVLRLSGDLIAAVERASLSFRADFDAMFRDARLELADDFSFLDPAAQRFHYAHGVVRMPLELDANTYLSSISESLRRVVDCLASAQRGKSVRERVALELAVMARRRETAIRQLKVMPYLERIAGTRVL